MKKAVILLFAVASGTGACHNFEDIKPDYKITTGYFSYQFPVRTIIFGDDIYDNSNDIDGKCVISAHLGGIRENNKDRKFAIEVDNSLCNNILFQSGGDPVVAMPANYYSLSSISELLVPKDKMSGGVEVQLTEAFFNDVLAIKNTYVIPIRLKSSNDVDSILSGFVEGLAVDERIASLWDIAPKNFTMYAVKYINEYHAIYLHYGESSVKNTSGQVRDSVYKERYVEFNRFYKLSTIGRKSVQTAAIPFRSTLMTGSYQLVLTFDNNNQCVIQAPDGVSYTVTGTGKFIPNPKVGNYTYNDWDQKYRNVIEANYSVEDEAGNTYTAKDFFVVRDRGVAFETYSPALAPITP